MFWFFPFWCDIWPFYMKIILWSVVFLDTNCLFFILLFLRIQCWQRKKFSTIISILLEAKQQIMAKIWPDMRSFKLPPKEIFVYSLPVLARLPKSIFFKKLQISLHDTVITALLSFGSILLNLRYEKSKKK